MSPHKFSRQVTATPPASLFEGLPEASRQRIATASKSSTLSVGQRLWATRTAAKDFTVVVSGYVKLTRLDPQGRETTLNIVSPGHFISPLESYRGHPYRCSAAAIGETQILSINREVLLDTIRNHPGVALSFMDLVLKGEETLWERIHELSSLRVAGRVTRLLLRLAETIGRSTASGAVLVPVRLTRGELAGLCSTTPETVCRQLARAPLSTLVSTHSEGFTLHDLEALRDIADGIMGFD
jgi:CRP/FNR family transcriptional regulator, nitrogen oxide reductase regulator